MQSVAKPAVLSSRLERVMFRAESLKIVHLVGPAARERDDVIDLLAWPVAPRPAAEWLLSYDQHPQLLPSPAVTALARTHPAIVRGLRVRVRMAK